MNGSNAYPPPPPPTDGPNTRQRSAAGLPLISGSTAPLPTLAELSELPPWSAVSHEFDQPLSGASFYPTPALAGCDVFSPSGASSSSAMKRVVSSVGSIVDRGSPSFLGDTSSLSVELPEFVLDQPTGSSFGFDLSSFPATASPAGAGFGFDSTPTEVPTPSPHMTMTREEWLRLGGFNDDALGASAGLSTSGAGYRLPPPPMPQAYNNNLRNSSNSSYELESYGTDQWASYTRINPSSSSSKQTLEAPSSLAGWSGQEQTQTQHQTSQFYAFPSPAASQASPARDRGQSRRVQARTAPSPSIVSRPIRRDPYPTTASVTASTESLEAEPELFLPSHISPAASTSSSAPSNLSAVSLLPSTELPRPATTTRKSHARKASVNHIPRPRNAFILFRSSAVTNGLIPTELGLVDHKNISKVIGEIWRGLGEEERGVWERMAQLEKAEHARKYPGYTYKPKKREDRLREKEEQKARANAGKPQRVRNRSKKDQQVAAESAKGKEGEVVEWDDKRCSAAAQALLEGEDDHKILAKVEQVLAEQVEDDQGSSQETVKRARARSVKADGDEVEVAPKMAIQQSMGRQEDISVFTLPSDPYRSTRISPPRPPLSTSRSSPADGKPATALPQYTPHKQPLLMRRAHSSSEGSPTWPSPGSSISSSSTISPSSAQRAAQQQRLELPTPTRVPHPFAQSPITRGKLKKQQSFAMAGLGISASGGPPGAFARGASQWMGSDGPILPSLANLQPEGGFDNSPLLGAAAWGGGASRKTSLGRWELRMPSQSMSSRELAAQEEESSAVAHERTSSDQSIWGHESGASGSEGAYGTLDPSEFLEALDAQSEAPSWDSGHQPSSQSLTSSSHSSTYSASYPSRLPSYSKDGRVPSFHLGGQDLFAATSGDALFGAPPTAPPSSQAMMKLGSRTISGILGMVSEQDGEAEETQS